MINIAEVIPSKDVREYMEKQGRVLTDFEKATLVYNHSRMSYEEKMVKLKEIMETTDDFELRRQIQERIDYDERCISEFYIRDKNVFYEVSVSAPDMNASHAYFIFADDAIEKTQRLHKAFAIYKVKFDYEGKDVKEDDYREVHSALYYNAEGILCGYYSTEVECIVMKSENDRERFENAFIEIPHPFHNGDFIRVKYNDALKDEICIIECFRREEGNAVKERPCAFFDYSDVSLRVAYIYGVARFGHAHVRITDIEFAMPDESAPKYKLLCSVQDLLLGRGGLSELQFLCDELKNEIEKQEVELNNEKFTRD